MSVYNTVLFLYFRCSADVFHALWNIKNRNPTTVFDCRFQIKRNKHYKGPIAQLVRVADS